MEMVLAIILRILFIGYYLMMSLIVIKQVQARLLPNEHYVMYINYVNEKNRTRYKDKKSYYKALMRGVLIQAVAILMGGIVINHSWFTWISIGALVCVLVEPLFAMIRFPKLADFNAKMWVLLYAKRMIGIVVDCYIVFSFVVLCFVY